MSKNWETFLPRDARKPHELLAQPGAQDGDFPYENGMVYCRDIQKSQGENARCCIKSGVKIVA